MQEFKLEKTYFQFMSLPRDDKPYALEYMRLALEASKHNLGIVYFNQQEAPRADQWPSETLTQMQSADAAPLETNKISDKV
jgi:hypothetical protein